MVHGRTFAAALITCLTLFAALPSAPALEVGAARDGSRVAAQSGWSSKNWAGYAITRTHYTSVGGGWAVPTARPGNKSDAYSLTWIGIDGFSNSSLIQVGTEQDYYRGRPFYRAFWEILPAAETVITNVSVHPGDYMTAGIAYAGSSRWNIRITNTTTGQTFTTQQTYKGPGASAEWILEAPRLGSRPTRLAQTTAITFDHGTANGANAKLTLANRGRMASGNHTVAIASAPDSDTDGFTVADGSTAPSPPSS